MFNFTPIFSWVYSFTLSRTVWSSFWESPTWYQVSSVISSPLSLVSPFPPQPAKLPAASADAIVSAIHFLFHLMIKFSFSIFCAPQGLKFWNALWGIIMPSLNPASGK